MQGEIYTQARKVWGIHEGYAELIREELTVDDPEEWNEEE
jgi:hypothetical protein